MSDRIPYSQRDVMVRSAIYLCYRDLALNPGNSLLVYTQFPGCSIDPQLLIIYQTLAPALKTSIAC